MFTTFALYTMLGLLIGVILAMIYGADRAQNAYLSALREVLMLPVVYWRKLKIFLKRNRR